MKHQIDLNAIPKEKLRFAQLDAKLSDTKFEDKPIGYFHDAWIRFRKNKASVAATVIIILIVLFAFIVPVFTRSHMGVMDTYYAKKGPRHTLLKESLGIADGGVTGSYSEVDFIRYVAIGVGAEDKAGESVQSFKETFGTLYQPLNELISMEESVNKISKKTTVRFNAEFDTYLQVGFIYKTVTQKEYQNLLDYQNASGLQILYPLIENNQWNPDPTDANYWYKCDKKYNAVTVNEKGKATKLTYSDDLVLEDNYMRDEDGKVMYWTYAGGGTYDTAHYKIRILYYNYYYYLHEFFPNYIFGTDAQGYDLALRMAQGIQLSLLVAVGVSVINMVIGAIYGAIEGYYGGAVDLILERISDVLSYVPFIIVMTLFQMHLATKVGPIVSLLLGYVSIGWIGMAYRVRTQFYRFKNQEYVLAAHTLGANDWRIIWKHIFPNAIGTIITSSALTIPGVINSESMLSYLGIVKLGTASTTSLGTLLADASSIWTSYPHLMIFPAMVLSLLMICFNLFGNGLRDAFNPSLRGVDD